MSTEQNVGILQGWLEFITDLWLSGVMCGWCNSLLSNVAMYGEYVFLSVRRMSLSICWKNLMSETWVLSMPDCREIRDFSGAKHTEENCEDSWGTLLSLLISKFIVPVYNVQGINRWYTKTKPWSYPEDQSRRQRGSLWWISCLEKSSRKLWTKWHQQLSRMNNYKESGKI